MYRMKATSTKYLCRYIVDADGTVVAPMIELKCEAKLGKHKVPACKRVSRSLLASLMLSQSKTVFSVTHAAYWPLLFESIACSEVVRHTFGRQRIAGMQQSFNLLSQLGLIPRKIC